MVRILASHIVRCGQRSRCGRLRTGDSVCCSRIGRWLCVAGVCRICIDGLSNGSSDHSGLCRRRRRRVRFGIVCVALAILQTDRCSVPVGGTNRNTNQIRLVSASIGLKSRFWLVLIFLFAKSGLVECVIVYLQVIDYNEKDHDE